MKEYLYRVRWKISEERSYLLLLSTFCGFLLMVRMIYAGSTTFLFLGFNLVLAWIPYLLSVVASNVKHNQQLLLKWCLLFLWLLFFPNTAYILTDLFHLRTVSSAPMWYDLILLLSFACCGLLLGFHSVQKIHQRFFKNRNAFANSSFIFSIFFIGGIGIYLGRYERWNSWEMVTDPQRLLQEFSVLLSNETAVANMISLALVFAAFLTILYFKFSFSNNSK